MSLNLFFSIIIPTYNRKEFLVNTIKSCLNQSYKNFEIIVVDDGSTDGSEKHILECFNGISELMYFFKSNEERGAARNFGISKANGDYILFLDSDDLMEPSCLSNYADRIGAKNHPKVLFSSYRFFDGEKYSKSDVSDWNEGWKSWRSFLKGNHFASMICFQKRPIEGQVLNLESRKFTTMEDWIFNLRMTYGSEYYFISEVAYTMIDHENRSMNTNHAYICKQRENAILWIENNLNLNESELKKARAHSNWFCAIHSYLGSDAKNGLSYLKNTGSEISFLERIKLFFKILLGRSFILKIRSILGKR